MMEEMRSLKSHCRFCQLLELQPPIREFPTAIEYSARITELLTAHRNLASIADTCSMRITMVVSFITCVVANSVNYHLKPNLLSTYTDCWIYQFDLRISMHSGEEAPIVHALVFMEKNRKRQISTCKAVCQIIGIQWTKPLCTLAVPGVRRMRLIAA